MKNFKEKFVNVCSPELDNKVVDNYRQLISFIDGSLAEAFKATGDDRAQKLVTYLLSIRDYLNRAVGENGFRTVMMNEVFNILKEIDSVETQNNDNKKNELDLSVQKNQEESLLENDR